MNGLSSKFYINYYLWTFILTCLSICDASHFRGAIIMWKPVKNQTNTVTITFRISWRRNYSSATRCDDNDINSGQLIGISDNLQCATGCSGSINDMRYHCTDYSSTENWSAGSRSYDYTFPATDDGFYQFRYGGGDWISLVQGGGSWELRVSANLTAREDTGEINSSPVSAMQPIVRLQAGCNHTIEIPVSDADGDDVRCRWAESSKYECGGVCNAFTGSLLDQRKCSIFYSATGRTGWYAVAIQIEDFSSPTSIEALSSIPLQFLVQVFSSNSECTSKPEFIEPTRDDKSCIGVPFNTVFFEPIIARSGADTVSITEITTVSPVGTTKSALEQYGESKREWYVNITWSPTQNQLGANIFCFTAIDSASLSSGQRCVTLLGGVTPPHIVPDSQTPVGDIYPNQTVWTVNFDDQFVRPTRSTYITFYQEDDTLAHRVDVSTSADVTYPIGTLGRSLSIRTNFRFQEKMHYYVLMDSGVARGVTYCGAESDAVRDTSFWRVRIRDITPPVLSFTNNPDISNGNVSITWTFNEEVLVVKCTVQTPSIVYVTSCNNSWTGQDLAEGYYTLYIQGTDLENNVALPVRHTLRVDRTPPVLTIYSKPKSVSNKTSFVFQFRCNEGCRVLCAIYSNSAAPDLNECASTRYSWRTMHYNTGALTTDHNYILRVRAVDMVNNENEVTEYSWQTDFSVPNIPSLTTKTVACGSDISPNATGYPSVTDNLDQNPYVYYQDASAGLCGISRTWIASDNAGNLATSKQEIRFTSPEPPVVVFPSDIIIACGDLVTVTRNTLIPSIIVNHPCGLPVNITYSDPSEASRCGERFSRTWYVTDDCGGKVSSTQTIQILDIQLPDTPQVGQTNMDLKTTLQWPVYPGSVSYRVFLWPAGETKPSIPTIVTNTPNFTPQRDLQPGTKMSWHVEYILHSNQTVPSPIWGFETRKYSDLVVESIEVPPVAYSGQDFDVKWTTKNIGNLTTPSASWYDAVYISFIADFSRARRMAVVRIRNILFPDDGYSSQASVKLLNSDIGQLFVFVKTDLYSSTEDIDMSNNLRMSIGKVDVKLTPPPDLQIQSIIFDQSVYSGTDMSVRWTVKNVGTGVTAVANWNDRIVWSDDPFFNSSDVRLATIYHAGGLFPEEEYTVSHTISVPRYIFGQFYIIIQTDVYNNVFEHTGEGNNVMVSQTPVDVILTPPPDLRLQDVTVANKYVTGETIKVRWSVVNDGSSAPYKQHWEDRVTLVSRDTNIVYSLGTVTYSGIFHPGDRYERELNYQITASIPTGLYDLFVFVDYLSAVFEYTSKENNKLNFEVAITQSLPDLSLSNLMVTLSSKESDVNRFNISWKVTNKGAGPVLTKNYAETINALSVDYKFRDRLIRESLRQNRIALSKDSSYQTVLMQLPLPQEIYGSLKLKVSIDHYQQSADTNRVNNIGESAILTVPLKAADLDITTLKISDQEIYSGSRITVEWVVLNREITVSNSSTWIDEITLRTDALDIGSILAKLSVTNSGPLPEGVTYKHTIHFQIPESVVGEVYIHCVINQNERLFEGGRLDNNIKILPVFVQTPPSPDLIVLSIHVQMTTSTESLRLLSVKWTVSNLGNSMTWVQRWTDSVAIGDSSIIKSSKDINQLNFLGSFETSMQLESSGSYTYQKTFVVQNNVFGSFYVYVLTDADNSVNEETGEDNNIALSKDSISIPVPPKAELSVTVNIINEESFESGDTVLIAFQVKNTGNVTTDVTSWTDGIYIYNIHTNDRNEITSNAEKLAENNHIGALNVGETYMVNISVEIPIDASGDLLFYVLPDIENNILSQSTMPKVAKSKTFVVSPGYLPNLVPSVNISISEQRGGQPYEFFYYISNFGERNIARKWYDSLYLSDDAYLDPFDLKLGAKLSPGKIGTNETIPVQMTVFIPFDLNSRSYFLLLVVDERNEIFESNENDNVASVALTILETVSSDITVVNVIAPSEVAFGENMQVDWKLRNNGSQKVNGYKCDSVYLSEDKSWDIEDNQIGDTVCGYVTISPFSTVSDDIPFSEVFRVPLVSSDDYITIVKSRSNILDENLENNVGSASTPTNVSVIMIPLETTKTFTLKVNDLKAFYVPSVPAGETLVINLISDNDNNYNNIAIRFGKPATLYTFDVTVSNPFNSNQTLVVPNTQAGDYYLFVEYAGSIESNPTKASQLHLHAKLAKFEILRSSPSKAAPLGNVTLMIEGTLFPEDVSAKLFNNRRNTDAIQIFRMSSNKLFATFDCRNISAGEFLDIELISEMLNQSIVKPNAIKFVDGIKGQAVARLSLPRALRPGERSFIYVDVQNIGDTDILSPVLSVFTNTIGHIKLITDQKQTDYLRRYVLLASQDKGIGGVLPPKAFSRFIFDLKQIDETIIGRVKISVTILPPDNLPHMYMDQKGTLQLTHYNDLTWDRIWNNFIGLVGETRLSLAWKISEVANQLSSVGRRVTEISDVVIFLLEMADNPKINRNLASATDILENDPNKNHAVKLKLERYFPPNLGTRYAGGPFGQGWIAPLWDTRIKNVSKEIIRLTYEKVDFLFIATGYGVYSNDALGRLVVRNSGIYYINQQEQTEYRYNITTGKLMSVSSDKDNSQIKLYYDTSDRIRQIKHSSGSYITITYDSEDRIFAAELRNDKSNSRQLSNYRYSLDYNHLISVSIDSEVTFYVYNDDNSLQRISRAGGATVEMDYTREGFLRSRQLIDYANNTERNELSYHYDGATQTTITSRPDDIVVTYSYDEFSRVVAAKRQGFLTDKWVYLTDTKTVYQGDAVVTYERVNKEKDNIYLEDGNRDSIEIAYDALGNVKSLKDGGGNEYSLQRYFNGSVKRMSYPDGSSENYIYYSTGHEVTSRTGAKRRYEFNDQSRLVFKDIGINDTTTYRYEDTGNMVEATNQLSSVSITYDENAQPKSVTTENGTQINYSFDRESGLKTRISTSSGYDVEYIYNNNDLLTEVINRRDNKRILKVEYTREGKLRKRILGNGAYTEYNYNKINGLLRSLRNFHSNGTLITKYEYDYDIRQRRIAVNTINGKWNFRYDIAGQVTYIQRPDGHETQYMYDKRKNRRYAVENGVKKEYESSVLNQYLKYGTDQFDHDKNGNLISKRGQIIRNYEFDEENKLRRLRTPDFDCTLEYDAVESLRRKRCKQDVTEYLVDPFGRDGPDIIQQIFRKSNVEETSYFYYGGDQLGLIAMENQDGFHYYQFDPVGSVVSILNKNEDILNSYEYEPFGQLLKYKEGVQNPFKYIGQWGVLNFKEIDELYYMRARFYDAQLGKFLSMDPVGIAGRSKNFYAYVYNNPIQLNDPKGTFPVFLVGAAVNVASYWAVQYVTGGEITLGGTAGAAVTGAIGGVLGGKILSFTSTLGSKVASALANKALFFNLNVLNAVVGTATQTVIDTVINGKPFDGNAFGGSILNALAHQLVPGKIQAGILGPLLSNIGSFLLTPGSSLKEKWEHIKETWKDRYDAAKDTFNKAKESVKEAWNNAKDLANREWDKFKDYVDDLKDRVKDGWQDFKQDLKDRVDDIKDKVKDTWNDVKDKVSDTWDNIKDEVNDKWNDMRDKIDQTWDDLKKDISDNWDDLKNDVENKWDDFKDKLDNKWNDIKDKVENGINDALNDLENGWDDLQDKMKDFGDDLKDKFDDLADKLEDGWDDLKDKMKDLADDIMDFIRSRDPNDMIGPAGYGAARFISKDIVMNYKIRFENDANASAPAQRVYIEHIFDTDLNPRTFRIGTFGFGNFTRELQMDKSFLQENINMTQQFGIFLRIRGGLDIRNGKATWEFQSIDPETGAAPNDPRIGFLPPNNGTTGQGFVTFSIQMKEDVTSLTRIDAMASIYFDQNEPIDTPPIFNTIDDTAPTVNATVIEETLSSGTMALSLNSTDIGAGLKELDIFVKEGTNYNILLSNINSSVAVLPLLPGNNYELLMVPVDYVGNRQALEDLIQQPAFSVYFPMITVACVDVNNCSDRGNCTGQNICLCEDGYYGNDCGEDTPPIEPPILQIMAFDGFEDKPIRLYLQARLINNQSTDIFITVEGYPTGTSFDTGQVNNNYLKLDSNNFGDVMMTSPKDFSGNFTLTVTAYAIQGNKNKTRIGTLPVHVRPVIDNMTLELSSDCYNSEIDSRMVKLIIDISIGDSDLSEKAIVLVKLPLDYTSSSGVYTGNGIYRLDETDLNNNINISLPSNTTFKNLFVSALARVQEVSEPDKWKEFSNNLLIETCRDITRVPVFSSSQKTPGSEPVAEEQTLTFVIVGIAVGVTVIALIVLIVKAVQSSRIAKKPDFEVLEASGSKETGF